MGALSRAERIELIVAAVATVLAGLLSFGGANSVATFAVSAVALAFLATLVGAGTEQIGARMGPGATGVLQSALGNLPELFVGIFALRDGLVGVVQAALVGSILGNSLLVLGLAFLFGGLRNGAQRFDSSAARMIATLALLASAVLAIPTLAHELHTPAARHADALSVICAVVLLAVFVASLPFSLGNEEQGGRARAEDGERRANWPVALAIAVLVGASVAAAFVSDWFVSALTPATQALGISQAFTGLVIVALAGNAVENVVGVQLAVRNRPDYAISVILNSSLQVALALTPVLVLLSYVIGGTHLTLVLAPLLLAALLLAALLGALIVVDGESTWLEGAMLVGLYVVVAASFWWG
jgi:Ca2+:H+ antiporter